MKSGPIIPPLSVVRLMRADARTPAWKSQIGRSFRIGYYSRQDGTGCVWLVNEAGQYEQTVDQHQLQYYFEIVERSKERALYGTHRSPIPPLVHPIVKNASGSPKRRCKTRPHAIA